MDDVEREMRLVAEKLGLGATGKFPLGKTRPDDKGELKAAVAASKTDDVVFINFGKEISWLAMDSQGAMDFAGMLMVKAKEIRDRMENS